MELFGPAIDLGLTADQTLRLGAAVYAIMAMYFMVYAARLKIKLEQLQRELSREER